MVTGNLQRIVESIQKAKDAGASLRVGPELEICGYSCQDHLLENDFYLHCWEMLYRLLTDESCHEILLDIGMPVVHRNNRFNCRIICLNGQILLIRPKLWLAEDGNVKILRVLFFASALIFLSSSIGKCVISFPGLDPDTVRSTIFLA